VTSIEYAGTQGVTVYSPQFPGGKTYQVVLCTPTTWALEMSPSASAPGQTFFNGFAFNSIPIEVMTAIKESHQITSCKVFWPLKQQFWGNGSVIPQCISTDSFIQDVYGIAATPTDPGVLLVSYTWEDDALKLESDDDLTLATRCLNELDRILLQTLNVTISPYVNLAAGPIVIHWEQQPTYRGCAKLYREGSFDMDYSLLTYNQNLAGLSNVYFAGEGYGVEGGWTEPALRMALDAVVNLVANRGQFSVNNFSYNNYPQWPQFSPSAQTRKLKGIAAPVAGGYTPDHDKSPAAR
jgi:tryptophan 2-monooxygenase